MISVVIPTHNRVDLLKRAIESVLNQSFNDFEIIVVSDGSTDGTDELMETFDDERVRYYKQFPAQGANVTILPDVEISDDIIVAAGSIVTKI